MFAAFCVFITLIFSIYTLVLFVPYIGMVVRWGDYAGAFVYILIVVVINLACLFLNFRLLNFIISQLNSKSRIP